eukprot:TRINITY_DN2992_c0_g1_i1.p1 TRINITY_DN2992_c0_g1~~TRINITY_DN2992_c0_g1_i1.p1  ORF type:complete len:169 (-),score=32.95 TRINITY_DN2992_c0_g1_i1:57-563(-)
MIDPIIKEIYDKIDEYSSCVELFLKGCSVSESAVRCLRQDLTYLTTMRNMDCSVSALLSSPAPSSPSPSSPSASSSAPSAPSSSSSSSPSAPHCDSVASCCSEPVNLCCGPRVCDVVPVAGHIVGTLARMENECRTALLHWDYSSTFALLESEKRRDGNLQQKNQQGC